MLNESTGGAAFLTASGEVPPIGARVELIEMPSPDPLVRAGAGPLPRFGRVIRHDAGDGLTRRVAVRFEADRPARRCALDDRTTPAVRWRSKSVRTVPPLADRDGCRELRLARGRP